MHQTIVTGNLGRDPEMKKFENGGFVVTFSVGTTERGYKTASGIEVPPHTEWYNCEVKGKLGEIIMDFCKKGHKVQIICRKHTRKYTGQDGQVHEIERFIVSECEMLTPKERRNDPAPKEEPAIPPVEETLAERHDDLPF